MGWRPGFDRELAGADCVFCPFVGRGEDETEWASRIFVGTAVHGYVWRTGVIRGYTVAIWSGRHVAEPTDLSESEQAAYWAETMLLGTAVQECFTPAKVNYLTMGNNAPHLHTHIVPRPWQGDPAANAPIAFSSLAEPAQPEADVARSAALLREWLSERRG